MQHEIKHLRTYINIVKPTVTISFSRKVTSVGLSNFIHDTGLDNRTNLIDIVGNPHVVSFVQTTYLNDDRMEDSPTNYSTIVISHLDPNVDKHTSRSANGYGLIMDITWHITFKILSLSVN
jgi:hypothetical protein